MTRIRSMICGVAVCAFALLGHTNEAQAECGSDEDGGGSASKFKTVTGPDGRKVIVIQDAFVVCGKAPRPNVIYVLQATAINYEWENLKQDFLPKIRKSVNKAPF